MAAGENKAKKDMRSELRSFLGKGKDESAVKPSPPTEEADAGEVHDGGSRFIGRMTAPPPSTGKDFSGGTSLRMESPAKPREKTIAPVEPLTPHGLLRPFSPTGGMPREETETEVAEAYGRPYNRGEETTVMSEEETGSATETTYPRDERKDDQAGYVRGVKEEERQEEEEEEEEEEKGVPVFLIERGIDPTRRTSDRAGESVFFSAASDTSDIVVDEHAAAREELARRRAGYAGPERRKHATRAEEDPAIIELKGTKRKEDTDEPETETTPEHRTWGYGWVLAILFTAFGSVTLATYLVLLESDLSIPNIMVNVSIFSLLFFLILIFLRYFFLIIFSFLHHAQVRIIDEVKSGEYRLQKASVLVPAYNEGKVIERSIESLLDLNYPNYEVIVIDDGSTDDTLELARKWEGVHENVKITVLTQENLGKAKALNHGASVATGDVIVCMDGDSRLDKNTLNAGMRHFDNPKIAGVAGNVKVVNRNNLVTKLQTLEYVEGLNLVRRAQAFITAVNIVPGPIGFFRREALLEVGGWENDTFAEDCDLTLKLLTRKYRIDYEPDAISNTEAPEKLQALLKQRYRWTRGILQSMRKHSSFLINTSAGWRVMFTLWQMVFEAVMWPLMNIMANVMFLVVALIFGISPLLVLWWVQLTILDTIAAMHAVAIEKEDLSLVPLAVIYRLVFIQIVDVTKMLATVEELLGVKMGWGKLEREGRL